MRAFSRLRCPGTGHLVWQLSVLAGVSLLFYVKKPKGFLGKTARKLPH